MCACAVGPLCLPRVLPVRRQGHVPLAAIARAKDLEVNAAKHGTAEGETREINGEVRQHPNQPALAKAETCAVAGVVPQGAQVIVRKGPLQLSRDNGDPISQKRASAPILLACGWVANGMKASVAVYGVKPMTVERGHDSPPRRGTRESAARPHCAAGFCEASEL